MAEVVKRPHFPEMGYRLQILPGSKGLYSVLENVVINVTSSRGDNTQCFYLEINLYS